MNKCTLRGGQSLALATLLFTASAMAVGPNRYDKIDIEETTVETTLPDGSTRMISPSCGGGPLLDGEEVTTASEDFYFFVQKGNTERVMFFFDGGGACWNAATCISGALAGTATYTQELDETSAGLSQAGGVLDRRNPANPVRNFTKVFIPYCTADIHWASQDTVYTVDGEDYTFHHRGLDNFLAVLDWFQKNGEDTYGIDLMDARNVVVTGSSAGGYGATLGYPYLVEMTPEARHHLISDAAVGVLSAGFFTEAIYNPEAPGTETWSLLGSLPPWVPGLDEDLLIRTAAEPDLFTAELLVLLGRYNNTGNIASLTTNFDSVQIFFYALQEGISPAEAAGLWYDAAAAMLEEGKAYRNYRVFVDDGAFHTFLGSNDATYEVGALGIPLADWLRSMIRPGRDNYISLDAGPPTP